MKIVTFQDRIKLAQDVIYSVAALPKDHHYMQGSGMDLANIAREEAAMEETFTNINQETIKKIIDPLTLRFRSRRIEEHYESTMLAPNRLVKLQLGTPQIFFFYCLVVYPYLIFMNGLNITMDYRFYTWMILVAILTMWMTIAHYDQGILFARLWYATTGSRMFTRMLLVS
ncbi:uncharacterized protein BJ171DRAFT_472729 [Polychytrium aggregatum]|uniref:uncharacterized protein n=1 Tax=Polychytrium aggregatum TaxID=110093 RepID=UPI0022FF086A|nr:uncharacterized protein BJ171DRAFT_472729 [Polychytrium aggregatum]KAI9207327.1 hypothetical protein BJ171DRAFT_472729 [Polychytrium aggregatum]